ncbi:MAG TPA: hypothetical protein VGY53_10980, partial [Isosphaeraceae bacterium]|nr:hypothetical protein [Isosphaeraceae bacterium]
MRPTTVQFMAALLLVCGLPRPGLAEGPNDDGMPAVIAAVRAEEAKYRDIEYYITITTRTADPAAPDPVTSEERRRVVLQGDRVYFWSATDAKVLSTERHKQEVSAYDGERTRTVLEGNCANIHLGRFEHPDVYPPHSLSLAHFRVNFPLSTYLSGIEAIHAHPKYDKSLRERGTVYELSKVEAQFDGEEQLAGLRCLKIRSKRWSSSTGAPVIQELWLAPERNYLCVKERVSLPNADLGDLPAQEMSADELREIASGVWFPMK